MNQLILVTVVAFGTLLLITLLITPPRPRNTQPPLKDENDCDKMKRYEQTVRVSTVFFSAIMGFGLKHLLDDGPGIRNDHWACFVIALLLFLRFLYGSANHLWAEYVKRPPTGWPRNLMLWDFSCLAIFGFFALQICYSDSMPEFFGWNIAFGLLAAIVAPLEALLRSKAPEGAGKWWKGWLLINLLYALSIYVASYSYSESGDRREFHGSSQALVWLVLACWALLLADLWHQLKILDETA